MVLAVIPPEKLNAKALKTSRCACPYDLGSSGGPKIQKTMVELRAIKAVPMATRITKGSIQIPSPSMKTRKSTKPIAGMTKRYSHSDD
jgi:hypothetical protein